MAMGIDQEIQRRMDAYRGNPQALQKRYQMSQQLIDLLALQKLKAEKDAVARQMQAQMQQTPGTVAQQMEQEMVGRTKQELAQQTAGIMQQKARQQQRGIQRMAQAAARPQGGLGSLSPQTAQPAPRMAGGGIVAFSNGALIQPPSQYGARPFSESPVAKGIGFLMDPFEERRKEVLQGLRDRLARGEKLPSQVLEALAEYEREFPGIQGPGKPDADLLARRRRLATQAAPEKAEPAGGMAGVDDREGPPDLAPGPDSDTRGRDMGGLGVLLPGETVESGAQPKRTQPSSVISGVRDIQAPSIPEQSSRTGEIESGIAALRKQGDPMEQLRQLSAFTDEYMRRGDIRKAGEERARRLAELDRAQMDPETLRRERLMASLIGAAGKSTFGLTGAGAAAGAENTRRQQRIAERQRLIDQMALERETEKTDIELAKEGLAAGKVGYEQAALNRRAAEDIAMRLGADETKRVVQSARSQLEALVANQKIDIEAAKDVAAQALQALKESGDDRRALEKELGDVQRKRADFFKEAMRLAQTNASLTGKPLSAEEKKAMEEDALLTANAWANEAGLLQSEQRLEQRIRELGGNVGVRSKRMISQ